MIEKLPILGFALVTAFSGKALAHESCDDASRGPTSYGSHRQGPAPRETRGQSWGHAEQQDELRHSDLNRDGWVTLGEALDYGRHDFRRSDRDRNHLLTRREVDRGNLARYDWNRDGRVTYSEHQSALQAQFASLDTNRDGYLARYELERREPRLWRTAGWRR